MIAIPPRFVAAGVALVVGIAQPIFSQSPWVIASRVAVVEQRVDAGFGPERFSGVGLGLDVERRLGARWTIGVRAQSASIRPANSGDLDRRVGEAELGGALAIAPWWGFYGAVSLRAIANDAGRQRWLLGRIGAEAHPAFTGDRIRAVGRLGMIPITSVGGLSTSSIAFDGAIGLEYDPPPGRVTFRLLYGLERFALASSNGNRRAEQLSTLTFRAGIRLPRRT